MGKTIPVTWRVCNCTDFYLPDGIIRTLLVNAYPRLSNLNKQPCTHKQQGFIELEQESAR